MIPIHLSRAADADLDSILDYSIAAHGRGIAEAYLRLIHATIAKLSEFPELGPARPELKNGLRSLPVEEHRVYYRFEEDTIRVVRVLHKAMDVERHL